MALSEESLLYLIVYIRSNDPLNCLESSKYVESAIIVLLLSSNNPVLFYTTYTEMEHAKLLSLCGMKLFAPYSVSFKKRNRISAYRWLTHYFIFNINSRLTLKPCSNYLHQ